MKACLSYGDDVVVIRDMVCTEDNYFLQYREVAPVKMPPIP